MAILITGAAGFIGANLASELVSQGETVFGVDNFSLGNICNLDVVINDPHFSFIEVDLLDIPSFRAAFVQFNMRETITEVWHLAANSDISAGIENPMMDLNNTFLTTFNTLSMMKEFKVSVLAFASSSAIYGDLNGQRLTEDIGPLLPISNYGAMKLASEAAISAAAESFLSKIFLFRFPNVIGTPATHGVILDFVRKLKVSPNSLEVLGNGKQQKSYLHVDDLISAMLFIRAKDSAKVCLYNIGPSDEGVTVSFIAEETIKAISPGASVSFGEGEKGWVGDVPRFIYSMSKLKLLGWEPKSNSAAAVRKAISEIMAQEKRGIL